MMLEKGLPPIVFNDLKINNISKLREIVQLHALSMGGHPDAVADLVVAVNEAAANIMRHGYHGRPAKIEITLIQEKDDLLAVILDEAFPFNPLDNNQPDTTLPLDQRQLGGMGVLMMRKFADQISYQLTAEGKNELTIRKKNAFKDFQKENNKDAQF